MKATEQRFPVVLFIMLYKVAPTFESLDEILKCEESSEIIASTFLLYCSLSTPCKVFQYLAVREHVNA